MPPRTSFLRSHDDRVLGGVCGGLGRAFGVDAVIFRIALGALVFAGGVGVVAYVAALLLVPVDDGTGHPAPREDGWRRAAAVTGGILLVVAALAATDSTVDLGGAAVFLALVGALGYAAFRGLTGREPGRDRTPAVRVLAMAGVGVSVLVGLGVVFWGSAWATAAGGGVAVAAVVVAVGVTLLVASLRGNRRARWLALPALVIAFPAAVVSAADVSLDGGIGERTYRPTGADALPGGYRLGAGELTVDLRGLDWTDGRRRALALDMGVGHTVVIVPREVCVSARTRIGAGYADLLGRESSGFEVDDDTARTPPLSAPALALDVELGMGALEVRHEPEDDDRFERPERPGFESRFDDDFDEERYDADRRETRETADRACGGTA